MKLFISHSHNDKAIADALIDFLTIGVGIEHNAIFCSSSAGKGVPLGLNFNDYIVKELQSQDVQVIGLITNNYFNSNYCMYELGASWGLCKNTIPILGPRMQYANMNGFLSSNIGVQILNDEDINKLTDDLRKKFHINNIPLGIWQKAKKDFFEKIKLLDRSRSFPNKISNLVTPVRHNYRYKVVAFDFDGTLLQGNVIGSHFHYSWKEIWKFLGYDDKIRRTLYDRHRSDPQAYTYQDWCDDCANYFIQRNFHRRDVKTIIEKEKLKVADGLLTTLKGLKKHGIVTAIISGGVNTFYDEAIETDIKSHFDHVFFNSFDYDYNGYLKKIVAYQNKESDFGGKVDALKEVCSLSGCSIEEAVFIGEGTNDIAVGKSGCMSIAYPPSATVDFKDIADVVTEDFNLATILSEVLIPKEQNLDKRSKKPSNNGRS